MKGDREKIGLLERGALECPKCGKRVLVQQSGDKYRCLWCNFSRDLSDSEPEGTSVMAFVVMVLVILVLLL